MISKHINISGKWFAKTLSGITILILLTACYAIFMFWTSINNYRSAVNMTSTVENHLLAVQSKLNRQARIWNTLNFAKQGRYQQQELWSAFTANLTDIQRAAIETYADIPSSSKARPDVSRFLALYGDITRQYQQQKTTLMLGDQPAPSSRQKLSNLLEQANVDLDRSVAILHGRVSNMTADNREYIDNGSTASIITFSLGAATLLFLFSTFYYRMRSIPHSSQTPDAGMRPH